MYYDKLFKIPYTGLEQSLDEWSKLNSVELYHYVWIMLYLWNVLTAVS